MAPVLRRVGLLTVVFAATLAWGLPAFSAEGADRKPNILVIVGDDMGYGDLGIHGCRDIPTPHLDALAQSGVRCTNGYVSGPYCSPTRAGLLTGRYQQRFGHEFNPGPVPQPGLDPGLPASETTLADWLKTAGYATGLVGKWHLGYAARQHPLERGFDEYFGFLGGAHSYTRDGRGMRGGVLRGRTTVDEPEYLTDAFAREALAFIDRHKDQPFFLYLCFNAVHTPLEATAKYLRRFEGIADGRRRTYAAMMSAMDDAVGRVLSHLETSGLDQQTLVFFISDNGGPPANASQNGALRGRKAQTLEGGIRVPFFVRWKGRLPEGKTFDRPVIQLDIAPTAMAAAGATVPANVQWDGVDLLPYLRGERQNPPHERLFWRFGRQMAIREGNLKLVRWNAEPARLFDLAADVGESRDLSAQRPDDVRRLQAAWDAWNAELRAPLWPAPGAARRRGAGAP